MQATNDIELVDSTSEYSFKAASRKKFKAKLRVESDGDDWKVWDHGKK